MVHRESKAYPSSMVLLLPGRELNSTSQGEESVSRVWACAPAAKVVVTSIVSGTRACHVSSIPVTPFTNDPSTLRRLIMR